MQTGRPRLLARDRARVPRAALSQHEGETSPLTSPRPPPERPISAQSPQGGGLRGQGADARRGPHGHHQGHGRHQPDDEAARRAPRAHTGRGPREGRAAVHALASRPAPPRAPLPPPFGAGAVSNAQARCWASTRSSRTRTRGCATPPRPRASRLFRSRSAPAAPRPAVAASSSLPQGVHLRADGVHYARRALRGRPAVCPRQAHAPGAPTAAST